jgi:predicted alpha-1,2-mannosidase
MNIDTPDAKPINAQTPGALDPLACVRPEQGTASIHSFSNGNTLPLVGRPFAMTSWSPQTEESPRFYHPETRQFQGVRATRQPSPWIGDYGHFTLMPQTGRRFLRAGNRASAFRRNDTQISPHLFSTYLMRYRTRLELSATERCAGLRLSFPVDGEDARLILEPFEGESHIEIDPQKRTISGYTRANSGGVTENFACYFHAEFDCDLSGWGLFAGEQVWEREKVRTDQRLGAYAELDLPADGVVYLRLATSFISVEQARKNLKSEIGAKDFDQLVQETAAVWRDLLGRIQIEGATPRQQQTFYTCLYRALLFPRALYERDEHGTPLHYSPYDGKIHPGVLYADNGFWDTHRTVYPFLSLLLPERLGEIVEGWVAAYREGGFFPKWASPGYRACMIGTHLDAVVADAFVKGISGFDAETAYQAMLKNATQAGDEDGNYGRRGIEDFDRLGWVPTDRIEHAASRTQDFAYNDFCVAQVAKGLGHSDDAKRFFARALYYRNTYNPASGFMQGRLEDGSWEEPFDQFRWGGAYIEGSAWQCTWAVPHDPAGLIELMGGDEAFVAKLDRMLALEPRFEVGPYNFEIHEMTEMAAADFGQYAHSNQPVHHVLFLYACAGRPDRTQYWVRRVLDEMYSAEPDGFSGDEDNGEMSCWYLFNALGFYPLCPGEPSYVLGSPLFKAATIKLENGETLRIEAPDNSAKNVYAHEAHFNGEKLTTTWIGHQDLAAGGTLRFEMGPVPSPKTLSQQERPYSQSLSEDASTP